MKKVSFTVVKVVILSIPEGDTYGAKGLEILQLLLVGINIDLVQT